MKDFELKNTHPEDIEDLLVKIEKSFDIVFADNELAYVQTFGEMCDHIKGKIQLENKDDCTTQQAFYKLRTAISTSLQINTDELTVNTLLKDLLPRSSRRERTKKIEHELGLKLSLLRPPRFVTGFLTLLLLASFIVVFFNWQIGLAGLGLSIAGLWFSKKTANEIELNTLGELTEKLTKESYLMSRRNPKTYNENEIERILFDWFSKDLGIGKAKLTRDARLT